MSILTGEGLAQFADSKVGTPYVYGAKLSDGPLTQAKVNLMAKMYPSVVNQRYLDKIKQKKLVGKVCVDCSGLISGYTGKILGSSQLYSSAKKRLAYKNNYGDFARGTVLWRSGHVGVFEGKNNKGQYYCTEAKGIDYGTVQSILTASSNWKYGLTFSYMDYTYDKRVDGSNSKTINPYTMPYSTVKLGTKGEPARWVQKELVEAGYGSEFTYSGIVYRGVVIDGEIGPISVAAIKSFQQSAKLEADGIVGTKTRNALLAD